MQSRKRLKLPSSIDRLSGLSDEILCHILSFLPTKHSVATNILSRRWEFLWAHVPNLDFDILIHHSRTTSLSDIIHRVLLLHRVHTLNTFRLGGFFECSEYQLETWITIAIARNVRNLDLGLKVMLPRRLFTCKSLVELRLDHCDCGGMAGAVLFPRLKKLHLSYVRYGSDESFTKLISGCPVLEDLVVDNIWGDDVIFCCISSPTLKRLSVYYYFVEYGYDMEAEYRLEINAPSLRYLKVKDISSVYISARELTSLIEADLELAEVSNDSYIISALEFVARLCNVKYLRLSTHYCVKFTDILFAESRFGRSTIKFDKLSKLDLDADCNFLRKFLETADNLEFLIVHVYERKEQQIIWKAPQQVPTCLLSHLRTVTIHRFGSTENEFEMVSYLLKNAEVMNMMEIHCEYPVPKIGKFEALQKISQFPRGSKTCELHFD